ISLSSTMFFLGLIALGIYVSLLLIGRRHWMGGRDGESRLGHYLVRGVSLLLIGLGLTSFFTNHDWLRADLTSGKVSSLAPETLTILRRIPRDKPVTIEAFIGNSIPEAFVETRVDLINKLREFDGAAGSHVHVRIHDGLEPFTDAAARAEEQYGIKPERVFGRSGGRLEEKEIILGAAVVCGLERVIIPFFGRGIPVEYELIRSIKTATGAERKRLGVVETDAKMMGGLDMATFQSRPKERIVQELEKQYEVERVDASSPINENRFDVLLVVQPSSLAPAQMEQVVAAIRNGIPTAVFEDPVPLAFGHVPGTGEPRRPAGNPMFGGGPPPEAKADLSRLWRVLGIEMIGSPNPMSQGYDAQVIFQDYNPYRKVDVSEITKEWVFVSP
ncbi:MAG TPA: GldG family protein, partial [Pirellulaceae bacterium]